MGLWNCDNIQMKSKTFLLILDGPMGSGKTTTSKLLNEKLQGTARIALGDVKRFISGFDKDHMYNKISQEVILVMVNEYLKRGISVIVEWAMNKKKVDSFKDIANNNKSRFIVYQLDAPRELLLQRVKERTHSLINKPELSKRNIKNIEENFDKNYGFHIENRHDSAIVLNSQELNPKKITNLILKELK